MDAIANNKQLLCARYKMKNLGIMHRILGCEELHDECEETFSINESKYIKFVCNNILPNGGATVQTPMSHTTPSKDMCPKSVDERNEIKNIPHKATIGYLSRLVLDLIFPMLRRSALMIVLILASNTGMQ